MKEDLKKILDNSAEEIQRFENQVEELQSKVQFYSKHQLQEELRVTRIKLDAINMLVYRWSKMHKEIDALLKDDTKK